MNHRMRYLAAGVLSLLFLGLIYSWSNFSSAIGQEFGWDRESMRLVFTLSIITFCFGGFFGAKLNERLSFRATLLVAAVLLAGGFAGTAAASMRAASRCCTWATACCAARAAASPTTPLSPR